MSSQSIWVAYDPQWAASIRSRLNEFDPSELWLFETSNVQAKPQLVLDKYLGNPIHQHSTKKNLERHVESYDPMRADHKTLEKLNEFLENQAWRSAVDWTTSFLSQNAFDFKIWFVRFACLMKLHLFTTIEREIETFGNLNSLTKIPFSLRLIQAELPIFIDNNHHHEALDRLFRCLMIVNTILSILPKEQASIWHRRRLRILYSISNCYLLMKRVDLFVSTVESHLIKNENPEQQIGLYLLIGRVLLQTGDETNGRRAFDRALSLISSKENLPRTFELTEKLFSLFRNDFSSEISKKIGDDPISINNHSVILLYMSKLRESLDNYEDSIRKSKENIHEAVIYNMSTIYELESFRYPQKKQDLIDLVNDSTTDGFSLTPFKLPTN